MHSQPSSTLSSFSSIQTAPANVTTASCNLGASDVGKRFVRLSATTAPATSHAGHLPSAIYCGLSVGLPADESVRLFDAMVSLSPRLRQCLLRHQPATVKFEKKIQLLLKGRSSDSRSRKSTEFLLLLCV